MIDSWIIEEIKVDILCDLGLEVDMAVLQNVLKELAHFLTNIFTLLLLSQGLMVLKKLLKDVSLHVFEVNELLGVIPGVTIWVNDLFSQQLEESLLNILSQYLHIDIVVFCLNLVGLNLLK